jgi:hypothetical protein
VARPDPDYKPAQVRADDVDTGPTETELRDARMKAAYQLQAEEPAPNAPLYQRLAWEAKLDRAASEIVMANRRATGDEAQRAEYEQALAARRRVQYGPPMDERLASGFADESGATPDASAVVERADRASGRRVEAPLPRRNLEGQRAMLDQQRATYREDTSSKPPKPRGSGR